MNINLFSNETYFLNQYLPMDKRKKYLLNCKGAQIQSKNLVINILFRLFIRSDHIRNEAYLRINS